jgi:DNA-binding MarR family transcriptional regulator
MTGPPDPYETVAHQLAVLLRKVRAVSRIAAQEVHPDLDPTAYGLLIRLEETGGARLTDLAAYFGVGKPSLSRLVAFLARLGLVTREEARADGRSAGVVLTAGGAARLQAARRSRRGELRAQLERWPVEDVATFGRLLRKLTDEAL